MTVKLTLEKIKIDCDEIVRSRGLEPKGPVNKKLVHEVRRLSDPYVPFDRGPLKNTAQEEDDQIRYIQLYSAKQFYENKGKGLRGKYWHKRMIADRGKTLLDYMCILLGAKRR